MPIRSQIFASALALAAFLPLPTLAREDSPAGEIAHKLNDPMTQYAVAGILSAMSKAVLDMRVEPFLKAMERLGGRAARDLPPDATVGDVAGTDAGRVREELIEHVPRAMSAMGSMAEKADEMLPELETMAKKMRDAVPRH